jgi:hypothetical protein
MPMTFYRDAEKLKALAHYVCWKVKNPADLGAIKLNKALWVADIRAFVERGVPITGERYVKRQFGPVPYSILSIVKELEREGKIVVRQTESFGNPKTDYIALKRPDFSAFSSEEISLIDDAIDFVCHRHTAMGISDKTHDAIWKLAELGEDIPYEAMLASALGEVTPEDVEWAKQQTIYA